MARILSPAERQQLRPTVDWLMSEHGHALTEASAWDVVSDPKKSLRFIERQFAHMANRRKAFAEVKLSAAQAQARKFGDGRTRTGTSVQETRPTRGVPSVTPEATRKPGESLLAYQARLRQQILDLGKPANVATAKPSAAGSNIDNSFAEIKARLLASEELKVREIVSHGAPVNQADTGLQLKAALARMRSRGESVDPKSANFAERYKKALKETK